MPSLLDNADATGSTQGMDTSASQGSTKRDGSRGGEEQRRQLKRTASRAKREGEDRGSTAAAAKPPKEEFKFEQKSLNKLMLKAILKMQQTTRELTKQTQTYAEKVRQEGRGHTRGPLFVWAYLDLLKALQQRGTTVGTRTAQGIASYWARLEPLSPAQTCDEVRFCSLNKTYKADVKRITLNIVSPEKRLLVLEALSRTEAERKYGRGRPTATERELQTFLEELLKT